MSLPVATRLRACVFRLEPDRKQGALMAQSADACRFVYNQALDYRQEAWEAARAAGATGIGCSLGYAHLASHLGALRHRHSFLQAAPYHCLQQALKDLDAGFARFLSGAAGHPRFRRKGRWSPSMRFPDPQQIEVNGRAIRLPKLGWVKFRRHGRPLPGQLKQVTVRCVAGRWQCSVLVEEQYPTPAPPSGAPIGIDAGVEESLAIACADGRAWLERLPVATPKEQATLRRMARTIARRQKGSRRRARALARRQRYSQQIINRVMDARHKLTTTLAKNHGLIVREGLALKSMTKSARGSLESPGTNVRAKAGLNRALLCQGMGETFRQLTYKASWRNGRTLEVNPAYTSQTCPECGHVSPDNRPTRERFRCRQCGHESHADLTAARNILAAGLQLSKRTGTGAPARGGLRSRGLRNELLPDRAA